MAIRWLVVLCAWALLAQFSLSFPEEELLEEFELDEPEVPEEEEEVKDREKRQSGCKDLLDYCAQWPDKYCQDYKDYMKTNCPKKCGYCSGPTVPPDCTDKSQHCSGWKSDGFCDPSSQWHSYMKSNCAKTCGFCGGGGGGGATTSPPTTSPPSGGHCSVSGASNKVKPCEFDNGMCDWHNVPFDDDIDFEVRSSSSGGPSSGAGGSGKFLVTNGNSGKAQLLIPFELVLGNHNINHGSMCIRFNYNMKSGSLTLYSIENRKGSRKTTVTSVSGSQGSWMCEKVTVTVNVDKQLMFEASGGTIAIDDISFADGACS